MRNIESDIPLEQYEIAINRIEHAQSRIADLILDLNSVDELYAPAETIVKRMVQHKHDLIALLLLRSQQGESDLFYQGVIELFGEENDTLQIIKLETEYHVLNWSFEADKSIKSAEFAGILARSILASNVVDWQNL